MRSQVVRLTDVQRVSQHQIAQAPQGICHGGVGSFALQPVNRQPALLLFGEVSVTPLSCGPRQNIWWHKLWHRLQCNKTLAIEHIVSIPRIPCQNIFQNLVIGVEKAPTFERFIPLADRRRISIQALDVLQIGLRVEHPLGLWRRGDKHGGAGLQVWRLAGVRRRSVWSGAIHARLKINKPKRGRRAETMH